jgi:hypothetical protein
VPLWWRRGINSEGTTVLLLGDSLIDAEQVRARCSQRANCSNNGKSLERSHGARRMH